MHLECHKWCWCLVLYNSSMPLPHLSHQSLVSIKIVAVTKHSISTKLKGIVSLNLVLVLGLELERSDVRDIRVDILHSRAPGICQYQPFSQSEASILVT